ncbi:MAG: hydantoinase B/oxoprolinase family protein [Deltaproteobacteria bacterium]|nr:hydantoinase B/oxoprolinase family protein [Deltaproteobacteria bacterium]
MTSEWSDPILLTVITNRLEGITREMGAGMLRSSRSPIFAENKDFVTAVFDRKLRLVAQTAYIPVLMGASPFAVKAISDHFSGDVREGDVMILNDPYRGNNHPPDISVVKPVFFEGELRFWVLARGHHADIGGGGAGGYNPNAKTIWEEGLRIPPARLYEAGKYNSDVWNLILLNVRLPILVEGDLQCQIGACNVGEKALWQLLQHYGCERVDSVIEEILLRSERQMRARIREIPDGVYSSERELDHLLDTDPPRRPAVRVSLEVAGDRMSFDFTGTDPQFPAYYNSSYPNTVSSCYIGLFSTIAPDIKVNEGSVRPITVNAPEGSMLNPKEGAPTTQCTVATCAAIVEAVWLAVSQVVPQLVQAGWARSNAGVGAAFNPRTKRYAAFILHFTKGGGGATYGFDGWSHISPVSSMGGSRVPDPELHELTFPHSILQYELSRDSAGPGRWRGGYGASFRLRFNNDETALSLQTGSGTQETAPFGLAGGSDAPPGKVRLTLVKGETVQVEKAGMYHPRKGDIAEFLSAGGGGYGDPYERPADEVLKDVIAGLLSVERACEDYGVVIDRERLAVDLAVTEKLRRARHSNAPSELR